MKTISALLLSAAALSASAQDYALKSHYLSGGLSINGQRFKLDTVGASGNFCQHEGIIGRNRTADDGQGCKVRFAFARDSVTLSIPEAAREACSAYCGYNTAFDHTYYKLPAACRPTAAAQTERRFQTAYRNKQYRQAAAIKQQYHRTCGSFLYLPELMRTLNDLAVSYKNAGQKAACRQALTPLQTELAQREKNGRTVNYLMCPDYEREAAAMRFNLNACR